MNFKKQIFSFHSGKIMGVFISANNELLISLAFDRTVQIHDMKTFKLLKQFETDTMKCSSLYNDELLVIGTFNRTCMVYNIKTNEPPEIFEGHINTVCTVDINDQYMISSSLNRYIFVWDWKLRKRIKELIIPDEYYNRNGEDVENALFINFSLNELKIKGGFIIAAIHNFILIWDIDKDFELIRVITLIDSIKSFDTDGYFIYATQTQSYCVIPILEQESDITIYKNKSMKIIQKIIIDEKRIAFWYMNQHNRSFIKILDRLNHKELFKCEVDGINTININKNSIIYGDYYGVITLYDFS